MATITVTFRLPLSDVQDAQANALLELEAYAHNTRKTVTVS